MFELKQLPAGLRKNIYEHVLNLRQAMDEGKTAKMVFERKDGLKVGDALFLSINGWTGTRPECEREMEVLLRSRAVDAAVDCLAWQHRQYVTVAGGYVASRLHRENGSASILQTYGNVDFFIHGNRINLDFPGEFGQRSVPTNFGLCMGELLGTEAECMDTNPEGRMLQIEHQATTDEDIYTGSFMTVAEMEGKMSTKPRLVRWTMHALFAHAGESIRNLPQAVPGCVFLRTVYSLPGYELKIDQIVAPAYDRRDVVATFDLAHISIFLALEFHVKGTSTRAAVICGYDVRCLHHAMASELVLRPRSVIRRGGVVCLSVRRIVKYIERGYNVSFPLSLQRLARGQDSDDANVWR